MTKRIAEVVSVHSPEPPRVALTANQADALRDPPGRSPGGGALHTVDRHVDQARQGNAA